MFLLIKTIVSCIECSSFRQGRSTSRSSSIEVTGERQLARSSFRMFRRSMSKTELENEGNLQEGELGGKGSTLTRLFGRRTASKTEVICQEGDGKSATLGRRIGSTIMGAFGKKDSVKPQEHQNDEV